MTKSLIDITGATVAVPLRLMVDAEDFPNVARTVHIMDAEGRDVLRVKFSSLNGYHHVWMPEERTPYAAPFSTGPEHDCARVFFSTMDQTASRMIREWKFAAKRSPKLADG